MLSLFARWASTTSNLLLSGWHSPLHHSICRNSLILVALHKESFLHPPSKLLYRCLATTDLLVGLVAHPVFALHLMSVVQERWSLCRYARDAGYITGYVLILVSLMTMTAISVDRLLALLLGLRYKQIVTLKRTYIIVTTFWVFNIVASLCGIFYPSIIYLYSSLVSPFCLVISFASYTKIFCTLRYHQAQVGDQQQSSQTNAQNMARFRKAVYSALWVQLALVVCFAPIYTVEIVIAHTKKYSLLLVVTRKVAVILLYFNSTLNPFLYCWKISEVRQAVKQTIREALCWVRSSSSSSDFHSRLIKSRLLLERSRQISYWIKTNKWLNRIVAQAVVNSLYIPENNLTTD